jgi:hypothetical protein
MIHYSRFDSENFHHSTLHKFRKHPEDLDPRTL